MYSRTAALAAAIVAAALVGAAKPAQAQVDNNTLIPCAAQGQICRMPYPTNVFYGLPGVPGKFAAVPFAKGGSVPCTNEAFGRDPAPGQQKTCSYAAKPGAARSGGREGGGRDEGRGYDARGRGDFRGRDDGYSRRRDDDGYGRGRGDYDRPRGDYDAPPRYRRSPDDED